MLGIVGIGHFVAAWGSLGRGDSGPFEALPCGDATAQWF